MNSLFKPLLFVLLLLVASDISAENRLSVTLEQAAESVRKAEKGKILSAKTTSSNGVLSHRIQVLTPSGRVKIVKVPTSRLNSNNSSTNSNYRNKKTRKQRNTQSQRPSRYQKPNHTNQRNQQNNSQRPSKSNYQRPKTNNEKPGKKIR